MKCPQVDGRFSNWTRSSRYHEAFLAYEDRCTERHQNVYSKIASTLELPSSKKIQVLDVGVGSGSSAYLADYLPARQISITGIDVVPEFFSVAAQSFVSHNIKQMSFAHLDMLEESAMSSFAHKFDLVIASNVLYRHTTNGNLLSSLLRCCGRDATLAIVHSPSETPWSQVLASFNNWDGTQFGSERLKSTLQELALTIEVHRVSYYIEVADIIGASKLTGSQVDFLLWMLPLKADLAASKPGFFPNSESNFASDALSISFMSNRFILMWSFIPSMRLDSYEAGSG